MLASRTARRNSDTPSTSRTPLPNSYSEFRHRVSVTYAGGQTCYATLPFNSRPGNRRVWYDVECLPVERRPSDGKNDHDRLVHDGTLVGRESSLVTFFALPGSKTVSNAE